MNYKDVTVVGHNYCDLYSLNKGDLFLEDTFPEVWEVTHKTDGKEIEATPNISEVVWATNTETGESCPWFYCKENSAYAPVILKVELK